VIGPRATRILNALTAVGLVAVLAMVWAAAEMRLGAHPLVAGFLALLAMAGTGLHLWLAVSSRQFFRAVDDWADPELMSPEDRRHATDDLKRPLLGWYLLGLGIAWLALAVWCFDGLVRAL